MHDFLVYSGPISITVTEDMNWLILRGLIREQRHWGPFPNILETRVKQMDPSAQIFCIDFPGFGTEAHRTSPVSVSKIVDDVRTRWKTMGNPNEPWIIFAVSLGGMVAMNWVSRFPEDFKKIILVNSSISTLSPLFKRMKPSAYPKVFSLFLKSDIAAREETTLKMTTRLTGGALTERAKKHAEFALKIRKRDALSQIIAAISFQAPEKIDVPMLVLTAVQDELVDSSCSEEIAKKFNADIARHETANHDLPTDDPEWVAEQVSKWVNR